MYVWYWWYHTIWYVPYTPIEMLRTAFLSIRSSEPFSDTARTARVHTPTKLSPIFCCFINRFWLEEPPFGIVKITMADDSDNSSVASSTSDDDFLTYKEPGEGNVDREALVRKKLLENFYGKSAVAAAKPEDSVDEDDDDEDDYASGDNESKRRDDLDSPAFDAAGHSRRHVTQSNLHTLLETEENLALSVRTLESTMQTLVYENYSRFIDATDAIKSIGVNVHANEIGLSSLTDRMQSINDVSKATEESLGGLRDQVAEKIRVKRLLSRLDTLLKLPQTLKELIAAGKYRTAASNYLSARNILRKHSQGFESLRFIETECTEILDDLNKSLLRKLGHWSGRGHSTFVATSENNLPKLPKNISEIFECAGALYILQENSSVAKQEDGQDEEGSDSAPPDAVDADDLQAMAMDSTARIFDRMLDSHLIAVQERRFGGMTDPMEAKLPGSSVPIVVDNPVKGSELVPDECLEAILEVATLYGLSFEQKAKIGYLADFVKDAFASVLSHVRAILLDESANAILQEKEVATEDDQGGSDAVYEEISGALAVLVQTVREVASALSLPEIGIDPEVSATFVEEAMQLTDSMVRRRVEQKFQDLRTSVIQECLNPFVERAVSILSKNTRDEPVVISEIVQNASSTLSNCLQLVDDAIRSILSSDLESEGTGDTTAAPPDLPILRDSVQECTRSFTDWLANALECLAGGEINDPKYIVDVDGKEASEGETAKEEIKFRFSSCWDDTLHDMIVSARRSLLDANKDNSGDVPPDFILAIAEMCRLAEASVGENLDQSINTHIGGKKKSKGMFPTGDSRGQSREEEASLRFQQAAARALVLYTTRMGVHTADCLCGGLDSLSNDDIAVVGPRQAALDALGIVKNTAIKCAELFGGPKRGNPVEKVDQSAMPSFSSSIYRKTGVRLDVERLFKEKVSVLPELAEVQFCAYSVSFGILKIASRSLLEHARCISFSAEGFCQLQLDIELMKHLTEHYIKADFAPNGKDACIRVKNILSDALLAAGERCVDEGCSEDTEILRESKQMLHSFLTSSGTASTRDCFIIHQD